MCRSSQAGLAVLTLAMLAFSADVSLAQVTVSVNDISGRPGESAVVAVDLSGFEGGTAIQSYNLTVGTANGNVVLAAVDYGTGTLAGDAGFTSNNNAASFPTAADVTIGGFSTGTNVTTSGTLLKLTFNFVATGTDTITLTGTTFNAGDPAVAGASDLSAAVVVSNRFLNASTHNVLTTAPDFVIEITAEDAFLTADNVISFNFNLAYDPAVVSLGTAVPGDLNPGWTMNQSGPAGSLTIGSFFSGVAMTGAGVIARIPATALAAGTTVLDLNSGVFNGGTPVYADRNGSVTVTFVAANVAPVAQDGGVVSTNFQPVQITLDATDPDGGPGPLKYSLEYSVGHGTLELVGNVATYTPDFGYVGGDSFAFRVNDGQDDSNVAIVSTISIAMMEAWLSGVNEVPYVASPGKGWVSMLISDAGANLVGYAEGLQGSYSASHFHGGSVGVSGGVLFNLAPLATLAADGRSATYSGNIDIYANSELREAFFAGDAYINVHSSAYPAGELRGQVLFQPNTAPEPATVRAPSGVVIAGEADDQLFSVSWLPATDPQGDKLNYIFQLSTNSSFTETLALEGQGDQSGFRFTVGEAAQLYDDITDAAPGSVDVGGSVTVFHRLITTDGSLWTSGPASALTLTRGTVTASEEGAVLPAEFALRGNYPNPFNPSTSIQFDLPEAALVSVTVSDMLGREVMSLPTRNMEGGANRLVPLHAGTLPSGLYLYRVTARTATETLVRVGSMTLLK